VLSEHVEPVEIGELLASGESGVGYRLKERDSGVQTLVESVTLVGAGEAALDREVVSAPIVDHDRRGRSDHVA
jgi:hypothetical protein